MRYFNEYIKNEGDKKVIYTIEEIEARQKKKKDISKKIKMVIYIILIPLLIYNVLLIMQMIVNSKDISNSLGIRAYVIISGSMKPNLNIGDIVISKKEEKLNEGDIISFWQGQSVVTHRISKITQENGKNVYQTKGDNNNVEDSGTITDENIIGKVIFKIPKLGKLSLILQGRFEITVIVIIFLIYVVISRSRDKKKEERKETRIHYENRKYEN